MDTSAPPVTQRLGTGHGGIERSWIHHTNFERRDSQPDEIIVIHYDSEKNLIALGVIAGEQPRQPAAFPQSGAYSYTPDPPGWR